jgi:hypothetical protein
MKNARWFWTHTTEKRGLCEPFHWRLQRVVSIAPDPFGDGVSDEDRDRLFGTLLACQEFENLPRHVFLLNTQYLGRLRTYLGQPPSVLLKRWSKASIGRCTDGDMTLYDLVYSRCLNRWSPEGIGLEESRPWSHLENVYPLRDLWLPVAAVVG